MLRLGARANGKDLGSSSRSNGALAIRAYCMHEQTTVLDMCR